MLHPGMVYRHIILTIPEQLREVFYNDRHDDNLLSALMRCGYECLEDVVGSVKRLSLKIGIIVVVQTHGRSGRFNPHLHIIMTNGGIHTDSGKWYELGYFPYEIIHKKWQYHLLRMIKSFFGTLEIKKLTNKLWKMYPKGLVAHVTRGKVPESCRGLARYLAKYVV
ncbi:MAG: transposase [Deltaproteobacteria bacterium]|nr:transposase [Deltaproteobacteria bacterium]